MIVSIHQPQYIPWLGYFEKMDRADVFVFLDDVQFTKNDWQNRNKIRTAEGWQWLTVPVVHQFGQKINETHVDERAPWRRKHLKAIESNYKKAPFNSEYEASIGQIYSETDSNLSSLCLKSVEILSRCLNLTGETYRSSDLRLGDQPIESVQPTDSIGPTDRSEGKELATRRLVAICKYFQADTYYSGAHGRDYLDKKQFEIEKIKIVFQEFQHPVYRQCHEPFIPNMSVIDLLFNEGPRALEIVRSGAQS